MRNSTGKNWWTKWLRRIFLRFEISSSGDAFEALAPQCSSDQDSSEVSKKADDSLQGVFARPLSLRTTLIRVTMIVIVGR